MTDRKPVAPAKPRRSPPAASKARSTTVAQAATTKREPPFVPLLTGADLPDDLIERLCHVLCPPVLASVDMPTFVRLIGASHSLSAVEKLRVFEALPTLSQFQVDALIDVMHEELSSFAKVVETEWHILSDLSARTWLHLCLVADHLGAGYPDEVTERDALACMLKRKFGGHDRQVWVERALGRGPLGDHVFSAFAGTGPRALAQTAHATLPESF